MKHLILISAVILLSGCATYEATPDPEYYERTRHGEGTLEDLERVWYQCYQDSRATNTSGSMSGRGGNDIRSGSISSSSYSTDSQPYCSLWTACVTANGWTSKRRSPDQDKRQIRSNLLCIR